MNFKSIYCFFNKHKKLLDKLKKKLYNFILKKNYICIIYMSEFKKYLKYKLKYLNLKAGESHPVDNDGKKALRKEKLIKIMMNFAERHGIADVDSDSDEEGNTIRRIVPRLWYQICNSLKYPFFFREEDPTDAEREEDRERDADEDWVIEKNKAIDDYVEKRTQFHHDLETFHEKMKEFYIQNEIYKNSRNTEQKPTMPTRPSSDHLDERVFIADAYNKYISQELDVEGLWQSVVQEYENNHNN